MRRSIACISTVVVLGTSLNALGESESISLGPLYEKFSLTLSPGARKEAAGPFFYWEQKEAQLQYAVPPLFSYTKDPDTESQEFDFLYPIMTYDRFGSEYRFQWFQIFSFSGGKDQAAVKTDKMALLPFFSWQRSLDTNQNATALWPLYGTMKNRYFRENIKFVLWPLYVETQKKDVHTYNYALPFFHRRTGDGLSGWQFWPLAGYEEKKLTTQTNHLDEVAVVGGHKKLMIAWPFFFEQKTGLGTENPQTNHVFLPLYSFQRSPQRDSTTVLWPFITYTDDRARKYREIDAPYPLVMFARGEGKYGNRIWPLFSHVTNANLRSEFYLWPLYKFNGFRSDAVERERTRIALFLYSDMVQRQPGQKPSFQRSDLWPLFTARKEANGNERLQLLAPLEPMIPNSKSVERNFSPIWSIWRSETNPSKGLSSHSFLWNLYRFEKAPQKKKYSFLFGLFQYQSSPEEKKWRIFHLSMGKGPKPRDKSVKS